VPRPVTLLLSSIVIVVGVKNKVLEVVDTVFITVPAVTVVLVSELNTLPVPAPDGKEPTSPLSPDSMISTSKLSPDANGAADEAPLFDTVSF
jgi:hypothetical protein